jgi:hypothetical protein
LGERLLGGREHGVEIAARVRAVRAALREQVRQRHLHVHPG